MDKLPKRRKTNGPDQQLTDKQACEYAAARGVYISTNILKLLRRDDKGPRYLRINGYYIRYTRRFLDPYIEARLPQVIVPAGRGGN